MMVIILEIAEIGEFSIGDTVTFIECSAEGFGNLDCIKDINIDLSNCFENFPSLA